MILQSLHFIPFCVQKMIIYQIVARILEGLFLSMTLCTSLMTRTSWPMKILIVISLSTLELLQKSDRSTENMNYISRSCEKLKCIPINDKRNCFFDEQHIFLNPYILWDMVPAALLSLNHTNDRYSMSNQYPQPTTYQPRTDSYCWCCSNFFPWKFVKHKNLDGREPGLFKEEFRCTETLCLCSKT